MASDLSSHITVTRIGGESHESDVFAFVAEPQDATMESDEMRQVLVDRGHLLEIGSNAMLIPNLTNLVPSPVVVEAQVTRNHVQATTLTQLLNAISNAGATPTEIEIIGTIALGTTPTINIPVNSDIKFSGNGTLLGRVGSLQYHYLPVISVHGRLTLDGITVTHGGDGSEITGNGIRIYENAFLHMKGGYITGNHGLPRGHTTSAAWGTGVMNFGGTFVMDGGVIFDNSGGNNAGGVVNGGVFTMNDGVISDNFGLYGGGIVNGGRFTLNGGIIENNFAEGWGGGILLSGSGREPGYMLMNGGIVQGNSAEFGGGICITGPNPRTLILNGGYIINNFTTEPSGNRGEPSGGGIGSSFLWNFEAFASSIQISSAMNIFGNTATQRRLLTQWDRQFLEGLGFSNDAIRLFDNYQISNGRGYAITGLFGDVNDDGVVNMLDLVMLELFLEGIISNINLGLADVNFDGAVNMFDLIILELYLNGQIPALPHITN